MGKALALAALVAVFTVSAAACGSGGQEAEPSPTASPTPAPTPAVEMVKVATVTDIEGSLNIRSAASTDSEILSEAYAGDRFEVLTENYSEGWHEISYNGGKAYVSAEFVTVSEMDASVLSATPAPSADPDGETGSEVQATPVPEATPNAETPIVVNGSGRSDLSSSTTEDDGMTAESIRDTEDPERR